MLSNNVQPEIKSTVGKLNLREKFKTILQAIKA